MNVTRRVNTRGITSFHSANLEMTGCTLEARSATNLACGILVFNNNPANATFKIADSTTSGFLLPQGAITSAALAVADLAGGAQPSASGALTNTTLSQSALGVYVHGAATASIQGVGLQIKDNQLGGMKADGALALDMARGNVSGNALWTDSFASSRFGGLWLGGAGTYQLKLRDVAVTNSTSTLSIDYPDSNGLTLAGNAGSSFDLFTSPGQGVSRLVMEKLAQGGGSR